MTDEVLAINRRTWLFGPDTPLAVHVHQDAGARHRWWWSVVHTGTDRSELIAPAPGWATEAEAKEAARAFFGLLDIKLVEVPQ